MTWIIEIVMLNSELHSGIGEYICEQTKLNCQTIYKVYVDSQVKHLSMPSKILKIIYINIIFIFL